MSTRFFIVMVFAILFALPGAGAPPSLGKFLALGELREDCAYRVSVDGLDYSDGTYSFGLNLVPLSFAICEPHIVTATSWWEGVWDPDVGGCVIDRYETHLCLEGPQPTLAGTTVYWMRLIFSEATLAGPVEAVDV